MNACPQPRRTGKTTRLIHAMLGDPTACLVVASLSTAGEIVRKYPQLKSRVFSMRVFEQHGLRGSNFNVVHFDDLDTQLQYLTGLRNIGICTFTEETAPYLPTPPLPEPPPVNE